MGWTIGFGSEWSSWGGDWIQPKDSGSVVTPVTYVIEATWDSASNQGYTNGQVLDTAGEGVETGALLVNEPASTTVECASNELKYTVNSGFSAYATLVGTNVSFATGVGMAEKYTWKSSAISSDVSWIMGLTDNVTASSDLSHAININPLTAKIRALVRNSGNTNVAILQSEAITFANDTDYPTCIIHGGFTSAGEPGNTASHNYGGQVYVKEGSTWKLLWVDQHGSALTLGTPYWKAHSLGTPAVSRADYLDDIKMTDPAGRTFESLLEPLFKDLFTDTNGTTLASHTPDIDPVGTGYSVNRQVNGDTLEIQSNQITSATTPSATATIVGYKIDVGESDGIVIMDFTTDASDTRQWMFMDVRITDGSNLLYLEADQGSSYFRLVEKDADVNTQRGIATGVSFGAAGSTYRMHVRMEGSYIEAHFDDTNWFKATVTFNQTATNIGPVSFTDTDTGNLRNKMDNFCFYPISSTTIDSELDAI
jgi:hypothetical protein